MSKRGITPLIATVLLIGFTIALAAIIITWGSQFVRQPQERVGTQSELQLACSQISFDIDSIRCLYSTQTPSGNPTSILQTVQVSSNTAQDISSFILRSYGDSGSIVIDDTTAGLLAFNVAGITFNTLYPGEWDELIEKVDVIPKISMPGQGEQVCSSVVVTYTPSVGDGSDCIR